MKPSPMCTPELSERFHNTASDLTALDNQPKYTESVLAVLALISALFVVWYAGLTVSDIQALIEKIPTWFIVYSIICLVLFPLGFWFASLAHDVSLVELEYSEVDVQPETVIMLDHVWDVI